MATLPLRLPFLSRRPTPETVCRFALNHYGIKASQVPSELLRFSAMVDRLRPMSVLEIGTYVGGTLLMLCRLANPAAVIVSVDLPRRLGGKYGGGYRSLHVPIFRMFPIATQRLHLLRADSHDPATLDRVRAITDKLDVLFIDGDHSYEGVKRDFEMYSPLVRRGGLIAFHDIVEHAPSAGSEVHRFWSEVKLSRQYTEIVEDPRQGWAGIGVLHA
jgi:predicted O-methyltransferase YrrM